jgi:formylglycine-generating enzyme required for sulfatase activity
VLLAIGGTAAAVRIQASRDVDRRERAHVAEAEAALAEAGREAAASAQLRAEALLLFDADREAEGEARWADERRAAARADDAYARAGQSLEIALLLARGRPELRDRLADALDGRAALAEREGKTAQRDELLQRLAAYDVSGARRRRWEAPARLSAVTTPPGATVWISRYRSLEGARVEDAPERWGTTPLDARVIAQGSVVLRIEAEGYAAVRFPIRLGRGEDVRASVALVPAWAVPSGFIHVPEGEFLCGSGEGDEERRRNERPPIHPVRTGSYFVARDEVTFADWLVYLRALPEAERRERTPRVREEFHAVQLVEEADGRYRISLRPSAAVFTALEGERIHYPGRTRRADQDWLRMPVSGVSYVDAVAYAAWLDRTGRVPGARLCQPREWERAARGADDRLLPGGDRLEPDDANHDVTYGRAPLGFGPDEVGSHPASDSPFGVRDMAGNVWEWTHPFVPGGPPLLRGGSFYQVASNARVLNFEKVEAALRSALIGVRLCATTRP